MQFKRTDCDDTKCKENCKKLLTQFPEDEDDDTDFLFYHCRYPNCHDINLGKTSFHCCKCDKWMCQNHLMSLERLDEYEYENDYCNDCLQVWTSMD